MVIPCSDVIVPLLIYTRQFVHTRTDMRFFLWYIENISLLGGRDIFCIIYTASNFIPSIVRNHLISLITISMPTYGSSLNNLFLDTLANARLEQYVYQPTHQNNNT